MKLFFKSSNRIKGKVLASQVLPSETRTFEYPEDAATVILSRVDQQCPNFKIYFNGKKNQYYRTVAEQYFRNGEYITHFGQNSSAPLNKLDEINNTIREVAKIING